MKDKFLVLFVAILWLFSARQVECTVMNGIIAATLNGSPLQAPIYAIAYETSTNKIWAASSGGLIYVINATTLAVINSTNVDVAPYAAGAAISIYVNTALGRFYVTFQDTNTADTTYVTSLNYIGDTIALTMVASNTGRTSTLPSAYTVTSYDPLSNSLFLMYLDAGSGSWRVDQMNVSNNAFALVKFNTIVQPQFSMVSSLFFSTNLNYWGHSGAGINFDNQVFVFSNYAAYVSGNPISALGENEVMNGAPLASNLTAYFQGNIGTGNLKYVPTPILYESTLYVYATHNSLIPNSGSAIVQYTIPIAATAATVTPRSTVIFPSGANFASTGVDETNHVLFVSTTKGTVLKYSYTDSGFIAPSALPYNANANSLDARNPTIGAQIVDATNSRIFYASGDTSGSVWMMPFSACSYQNSCSACTALADPYCGWCVLAGTCTLSSTCPNSGNTNQWIQTSCPVVNSTTPLLISTQVPTAMAIATYNIPFQFDTVVANWLCVLSTSANQNVSVVAASAVTLTSSIQNFTCPFPAISSPLSLSAFNQSLSLSLYYLNVSIVSTAIIPITVYDCATFTTCNSCLANVSTNAYSCGWCILSGTCTVFSACTNNSLPNAWIIASDDTCPSTFQVSPSTVAIGLAKSPLLNVTVSSLIPTTTYSCTFSRSNGLINTTYSTLSSAIGNSTLISCPLPSYSSHSLINGALSEIVVLSIAYNSISISAADANASVTLIDCSIATTCESCVVQSSNGFCAFDYSTNLCSGNSTGNYPFLINYPPSNCALMTSISHEQLTSFPVGMLVVNGLNLPTPVNGLNYTCAFTYQGITDSDVATYINSTSISCQTPTSFSNPITGLATGISLDIFRGSLTVVNNATFIASNNLTFVTCLVFSDNCSECQGSSTFGLCDWCNQTTTCIPPLISDTCSSTINATCPIQLPPNCTDWSLQQSVVCDFILESQPSPVTVVYNPSMNPCSFNDSLVQCDLSGNVTGLTFPGLNLQGTLPTTLGQLFALATFDLSNNALTGTFPTEYINLMALTTVSFQMNSITGSLPAWTTSGSLITDINLSFNNFSGSIPTAYNGLASMQSLLLQNNQLNGTLSFTAAPALKVLIISHNALTGSIPSFTGTSSFVHLDLGFNALSGSVPANLINTLTYIDLQQNNLTGSIPTQIGLFGDLFYLDESTNSLSGSIPSQIGLASSLAVLLLQFNALTGSLPSTLGGLETIVELNLSNNLIAGSIPTGYFPTDWNGITANFINNNLTGPTDDAMARINNYNPSTSDIEMFLGNHLYCPEASYPTAISILIASGDNITASCANVSTDCSVWGGDRTIVCNFLTASLVNPGSKGYVLGGDPCLWNSGLYVFCEGGVTVIDISLSAIGLIGTIPNDFGNLTSLETLDVSLNSMTGTIPSNIGLLDALSIFQCNENAFSGTIPSALANQPTLELLSMSKNKFNGTIPEFASTNYSLIELALDNNKLTGTIPTSIALLSLLAVLNLNDNGLTGTIPTELGTLSFLTSLLLEENDLTGTIPSQLGNLANLELLFLSFNALTGSIPTTFSGSTMKLLNQLILDSNSLNGTLPTQLGSLVNQLQVVSIISNGLTGSIPTELGNLALLTTLTLDSNKLSGSLPTELGELSRLTSFSAENNALTGSIPTQWQNMDSLVNLILHHNAITGTTPSWISSLVDLENLDLGSNQLNGTIPSELGLLAGLQTLDLSFNDITGTIPSELASPIQLHTLLLFYNHLSGTIPGNFFPLRWNSGNMLFYNNNLTGPSDAFMANIENLFEGAFVVFSSNEIQCPVGSFPNAILLLQKSNDNTNDCVSSSPTPSPTTTPTSSPSSNTFTNADIAEVTLLSVTALFTLVIAVALVQILQRMGDATTTFKTR